MLTTEELAECKAIIMTAFKREDSPRRLMADFALGQKEPFPLSRLALAAPQEPPRRGTAHPASDAEPKPISYAGFIEIFGSDIGRTSPLIKKARSAMWSCLTAINEALGAVHCQLSLSGSIKPETLVELVRIRKEPGLEGAKYRLRIGRREFPTQLFHALAFGRTRDTMYLTGNRVAGRWRPPPEFADEATYLAWARERPKAREMFEPITTEEGPPVRGRAYRTRTWKDQSAPWNGRIWGCLQAEVVKVPGDQAHLIRLDVLRVAFRDYFCAIWRDAEGPGQQPDSLRKFLHEHPISTGGILPHVHPVHAVIFLYTLVVLPRAGAGKSPLVALARHVDANRIYQHRKVYWSVTAESLAVSMRLTEDSRGIDFDLQVRRMLGRQAGLESHVGYNSPVWLGAGYDKEYCRVELFSMIELNAEAEDVITIFGHRENRTAENCMALLHRDDIYDALKGTEGAPSLEKLLDTTTDELSPSLTTALGLYLAHENMADFVRADTTP